jgi:hypothetical protein
VAHNAVLAGVPIDLVRIYDQEDPGYALFIEAVTESVRETMKAADEKAKREARKNG